MNRLLINSYAPLVASRWGVEASSRYGIPPFVDGSIRREPDLQNPMPAISCLCRAHLFAPRLTDGDHVVYITKRGRYGGPADHWRLTAVLRVTRLFDSHENAAVWYRGQGLPLPNNCMVEGNPPHPVRESHRGNEHTQADEDRWTHEWDLGYRRRARQNSRFVVCEPLWRELGWEAPMIHKSDFLAVFGKVPGTRNPGRLPLTSLPPLLARLGVSVSLPAP